MYWLPAAQYWGHAISSSLVFCYVGLRGSRTHTNAVSFSLEVPCVSVLIPEMAFRGVNGTHEKLVLKRNCKSHGGKEECEREELHGQLDEICAVLPPLNICVLCL